MADAHAAAVGRVEPGVLGDAQQVGLAVRVHIEIALREAHLAAHRVVGERRQLGADAALSFDRVGYRALDLALKCDSRQLFATAKELVDACGAPCVRLPRDDANVPPDGLNALHRVLLRWASSYFPQRPVPNPWNSLAKIVLDAGGDPLEATRTPARETPLHLAVSKRNVEGAAMLLDDVDAAHVGGSAQQLAHGRARSSGPESLEGMLGGPSGDSTRRARGLRRLQ